MVHFHELGHVLIHGNKELYLNGESNVAEREADSFAAEILIPPESVARLPRGRNINAVVELAEELGIAPSIVLGRSQRLTGDYAWGHALKRKVDFTVNVAKNS